MRMDCIRRCKSTHKDRALLFDSSPVFFGIARIKRFYLC